MDKVALSSIYVKSPVMKQDSGGVELVFPPRTSLLCIYRENKKQHNVRYARNVELEEFNKRQRMRKGYFV